MSAGAVVLFVLVLCAVVVLTVIEVENDRCRRRQEDRDHG